MVEKIGLPPLVNEVAMTPREAFFATPRFLPLQESPGHVSAEIVTVYPPGIPLLVPGEVIRRETVDYLAEMSALGAVIDGLDDTKHVVRVVA